MYFFPSFPYGERITANQARLRTGLILAATGIPGKNPAQPRVGSPAYLTKTSYRKDGISCTFQHAKKGQPAAKILQPTYYQLLQQKSKS